VIAAVCTGHDYSSPGKPRIDRADPAAKDELVSALVNDANAVVAGPGDLHGGPPSPAHRIHGQGPPRRMGIRRGAFG
jgi:hypothetical protein